MKISVSLPEPDLAFLDDYVARAGLPSRSAAVHTAIRALRERRLEDEYTEAFQEWEASGGNESWDVTVADGLEDD